MHSAGIVRYDGIADTSAEDWQRMLDINVSAARWLCQAAWPGTESSDDVPRRKTFLQCAHEQANEATL